MAIKREELVEEVSSFFEGSVLFEKIFEILEKHQVSAEKSGDIIFILDCENEQGEIFDSKLLPQIPVRLQKVTALNEVDAKKMAVELVGCWLLPLESYVGDVSGMMKQWGGRVEDFSTDRITAPAAQTPDTFVADFIKKQGLNFEDAALKRRLAYILVTMVRGVRTPIDTQRALSRAQKVGGLDMEEDKAKAIVKELKTILPQTGFNQAEPAKPAEPAKAKEPVKPAAPPKPPSPAKPPQPSKKPEAKIPPKRKLPPVPERTEPSFAKASEGRGTEKPKFDPVIITEADKLEAKREVKKIESVAKPASFDQIRDKVVNQLSNLTKDDDAKKRLGLIVESRLKGVRDAYKTREALEDKVETGGLELKGRELVTAVEVIEKSYDQIHDAQEQEQAKKQQKFQADQVKKKTDQVKKKEEHLNQKFEKLTGKPAVPSPAPAETALSAASIAGQGKKPAVNDVLPQRRLVGPIEELSGFDLISFRRLSKDPEAAIKKIIDKIDLLENQSYAKKLEGIKAWLASPLNKMYVDLSRKALVSGKPIEQVIAAEEAEKKTVPNPQEVLAIMKMNQRLRF
jgi:hypothetical protein